MDTRKGCKQKPIGDIGLDDSLCPVMSCTSEKNTIGLTQARLPYMARQWLEGCINSKRRNRGIHQETLLT